MEHPETSPSQPVRERYAEQLGRTVDRMRGLAIARLGAAFEPEPSRAEAAYRLAQELADVTADLVGEPRRPVPRLADAAVGDQLAVTGRDLLDACADEPDEVAGPVLSAAADRLLDLRRRV